MIITINVLQQNMNKECVRLMHNESFKI